MIYFLLPVGSRKFVQWPRPCTRERFNRIHAILSVSVACNTVKRVPWIPVSHFSPAGRQFICKISQRCNTCSRGALAGQRCHKREKKKEVERREEKRLYYHVVPVEICMRKRANAITRRGTMLFEKNVAVRPTFPPIIRLSTFPTASVTSAAARWWNYSKHYFNSRGSFRFSLHVVFIWRNYGEYIAVKTRYYMIKLW